MQIDGGPEEDRHGLGPRLSTQGGPKGLKKVRIPGRAQHGAAGKARTSHGPIAAHAVGPIGHLQGPKAFTIESRRTPQAGAR